MPAGYNGTGTYLRAYDWTTDKAANIKIQAVRMDEEMDGFSAALSNVITRDGQSTIIANIPMGNNKLTGLAPGTMAGDSVNWEQVPKLTGTNAFISATGTRFVNTTDAAAVGVVTFEGDRASPADQDIALNSYLLSDSAGAQVEIGRFAWRANTVAPGAVDGELIWGIAVDSTMTYKLVMNQSTLYPAQAAGLQLGYDSAPFSNLFLKGWTEATGGGAVYFGNDYITNNAAGLLTTSGHLTVNGNMGAIGTVSGGYVAAGGSGIHSAAHISADSYISIVGYAYLHGGGTLGDAADDQVIIKGNLVDAYMAQKLQCTSAESLRANLGWGTAVLYNAGASGTTLPTCDSNISWTGYHVWSVSTGTTALDISKGGSTSTQHIILKMTNPPGPIAGARFQTYYLDTYGTVGTITLFSSTEIRYNTSSDGRMKRDVRDLDDSGDIIDAVRPVRFKWENGEDGFGFIAQELAEVVPGIVTPGSDGTRDSKDFEPWQLQYGRMEPILFAEVRALRARVAALEAA